MKYSIRDINLIAIESILRSKDTLMAIAIENFELKRSELGMKLSSAENINDQLIVISKEIEFSKAVVEQPVAQEFINLGLLKDIDAGIEQLRSYYATVSEEHEKFRLLGVFRATFGMSREQGLEHIDRLFNRDIETITEELQLVVLNVWTWKLYFSLLLQVRRDLANEMLTEEEKKPQHPEKKKPKMEWLGSQKNLAELFIELKAKGYLNHVDVNLIKSVFTESDTIDQILKPSYKKYDPSYDQVYTPRYSPRFDAIKPVDKNIRRKIKG